MRLRRTAVAVLLSAAMLLSGCSGTSSAETTDPSAAAATPSESTATTDADSPADEGGAGAKPVKAARARPLRAGERRMNVEMAEPYTPAAPTGVGTDDYRCFLLDPDLGKDAYLTGTNVIPGNSDVVHHVILFRVPPDRVGAAEDLDASEDGPGWTCFGGSGLETGPSLDDAPWLGAWAPGGRESIVRTGYGVPFPDGSRVVMQVHYNLLAGTEPDVSAAQLRIAPPGAALQDVETMLLLAPVELPCRPANDESPLCERDTALSDVKARFGEGPGSTADILHLLCGTPLDTGNVQKCTKTIGEPATVLGVAGHMHLLGRSIKIEVNPGTAKAQTLLNIRHWDFDNQGAKPIKPVALRPFDEVEVTCRHSQRARDFLPSFEGQPERYVMWGEGTTDEMCLGILQVTRP